jgi:anti-sigma regulatory factor (Ser/Thr protein kinase)
MNGFRHEMLLYAGQDEFVSEAAAFVRDGIEAGEPTFVVVKQPGLDALREAFGANLDGVRFADMAEMGRNPARIIPSWRDFVRSHAGSETALRGVGEPIFAGRHAEELVECQRHEALLNLAFAEAGDFWLLCLYDLSALEEGVIEDAYRRHPFVAERGHRRASADYLGTAVLAAPLEEPFDPPPAAAPELHFQPGDLEHVRRFLAVAADDAGLPGERTRELTVALNEIASNSLRYGGGEGVLRIWSEDGRVVCEIRDGGSLVDPLAGRETPPVDELGSRGLWIANQLCDLVQIRLLPEGNAIRLHVALAQ